MAGRAMRLVVLGGAAVTVLGWTCPRPGQVADRVADPQQWIDQEGLDVVAGQLAGLLGWLALAWLTAGMVLLAGAQLPGVAGALAERLTRSVLPLGVRRLLTVTLGIGIAAATGVASASTAPAGGGSPGLLESAPPQLMSPWPPEDTTALWTPPTRRTPLRSPPAGPPSGISTAAALQAPGGAGTVPANRPTAPGTPSSAATAGGDHVLAAALPTRLTSDRADKVPQVRAAPDDAGAVDWPLADAVRAVTVGPGDSLWLIAARRLDQDATVADIAGAWPEWYAANRSQIGPDPDLIRVGQRLAPP